MPLRLQNQDLLVKFEKWFATVEVLEIQSIEFRKAAELRANFKPLRTPDALHLATAIRYGCEFWTNDDRLNSVAPVIVTNILKN